MGLAMISKQNLNMYMTNNNNILNFDIISEIELLCKSPNVGTVSILTVEVIIRKVLQRNCKMQLMDHDTVCQG